MRITSFQIQNYKSFLSSPEVQFLPGFNIIVGKNNVGKTALVEVVSLKFQNKPHKSIKTVPYIGAIPNQISRVNMTFEITGDELKSILADNAPAFTVPINSTSTAESEANQFLSILSEIGARLSDLFGADDILWVEGATEELCFPLILDKVARKPQMGTAIIGVKHTGDFQGKHKNLILDIYTRLSIGRGLLPPAIGFIFDREGLSDQDRDDLERQSKGKVFFLPRRMYENYLLHPAAIASLMSGIEGFRESPVTEQEIDDWLDNHGWDTKYIAKEILRAEKRGQIWFANVDGAKVLKDMFTEISETRVAYDNKPEYGLALTRWLIEHSPDELNEIAQFVTDTLEKGVSV